MTTDTCILLVLVVLLLVLGLLCMWVRNAVGAYGAKSGEIRAIQENLATVAAQQRELTAATKRIEAEVAAGSFAQREKWKLKRDVWISLLRWHAHMATLLGHHVPDRQGYEKARLPLDAKLEYAELSIRAHAVLSRPMLEALTELERQLHDLEQMDSLWQPAQPTSGAFQRQALLPVFHKEDVVNLARRAGADLDAILPDDQTAFQRNEARQNLVRSAIRKQAQEEALSPAEEKALDEEYTERALARSLRESRRGSG
ncbi:MAG: hypothetical protein AB1505_17915 [Candidatus Latescibacterota bacterium]